jgi:2-dehydro-3-deoxyphosphogluconate aldolase/(4S)-4-hydroxy-2-oxoglutarate aldolase
MSDSGNPSRAEILSRLTSPGVIAVIRCDDSASVLPACRALLAGGVVALEITLTTPNAIELIAAASREFASQACVGAGSVTTAAAAESVIAAGARFVVSPILRPELVGICHASDRVCVLGAYTPTEAQTAHEAGADFIKIFPAEGLGAGYVKSLRGPLPHLKIIPTGGVELENIGGFFQAGCPAVGVGSSLVNPKLIKAGDWNGLTTLAKQFVQRAAR